MRTMMLMVAVLVSICSSAQDKNQVITTVFKASITCEKCEAKIMKQLPYEKGVRDVSVDVANKLITVSYKAVKNRDEQLNAAIEKLGYDSSIQGQPQVIVVQGNCDMCKERIEQALLKVDGVGYAVWYETTKEAFVLSDSEVVKKEDLLLAVASAGHDTETIKADDLVYKSLPECCQYKRTK